jgi:hypothetical protein
VTTESRFRLLAVPLGITLGVTVLRLIGELLNCSPTLFSRQPGGLGAVVGIIWLAPVFGVSFARRLMHVGHAPASTKRALLHVLAAFAILVAWGVANALIWPPFQAQVLGGAVASLVVVVLQLRGWPELGKTMLLYAVGARIPVVIIMFLAIFDHWGTHYDAFPPGFPLTEPFEIWFWAGLIVQMTLWVGITVLFGAVAGTLVAAVSERRSRPVHNVA